MRKAKRIDWEDYAVAGSIWFVVALVFIFAGIFKSAFVVWWVLAMFIALFLFMVGLYEKNK